MTGLNQSRIDARRHADPAPPLLWQLEVSHYVEKVRWALDYKRVPHIRRSLLPGLHIVKAKRLTGDTSTTPVLTIDGRSIGDSTRIIAAIEEHWPQPPLYPEDAAQRRHALELEEFFDEHLGPHIRRRVFYHELLPHPEFVVPLFTHGEPISKRALLPAGFPMLRVAMRRRFQITPQAAANSRAKMVAAMDRLEAELSASGYLVGDAFTVADLTAAALFYPLARPLAFPYAMVAVEDLLGSWRDFLDSLAQRPGGRWIAEMYRRHRGRSAELSPARATNTPQAHALPRPAAASDELGSTARQSIGGLARSSHPVSASPLARSGFDATVDYRGVLMTGRFGVVIVGARCAGSPLATLLARQALRVALVERAKFPRDTLSTHHLRGARNQPARPARGLDQVRATGAEPLRRLDFRQTSLPSELNPDCDMATRAAPCPSVGSCLTRSWPARRRRRGPR